MCGEAAVKSGANLYGANLYGANLSGSNLYGADDEKKVKVARYLGIGPIGSRGDHLHVFFMDNGRIFCCTGCFKGALEVFEAEVQKVHGDDKHGVAYSAAVSLIRAIGVGGREGNG